MDGKLVVRNAKTGQFMEADQATKNPGAAVFEEKRNGKIQRYRPCPIQDGEPDSGRYMLLESATTVTRR